MLGSEKAFAAVVVAAGAVVAYVALVLGLVVVVDAVVLHLPDVAFVGSFVEHPDNFHSLALPHFAFCRKLLILWLEFLLRFYDWILSWCLLSVWIEIEVVDNL